MRLATLQGLYTKPWKFQRWWLHSPAGQHTAVLDCLLGEFFPDALSETFGLQFVPCYIICSTPCLLHSYSSGSFVTAFPVAAGCSALFLHVVFHSPFGYRDLLIFSKYLCITCPSQFSWDSTYMHSANTKPGVSSVRQRTTQNLAGMQNKTEVIDSIQLFIHSYQNSWREQLTFGPKPKSQALKFVDFTSQ